MLAALFFFAHGGSQKFLGRLRILGWGFPIKEVPPRATAQSGDFSLFSGGDYSNITAQDLIKDSVFVQLRLKDRLFWQFQHERRKNLHLL